MSALERMRALNDTARLAMRARLSAVDFQTTERTVGRRAIVIPLDPGVRHHGRLTAPQIQAFIDTRETQICRVLGLHLQRVRE